MENFNNQWKTSTINGKLHELIKKKLGTFGEKIMFDVFNWWKTSCFDEKLNERNIDENFNKQLNNWKITNENLTI